MFLVSYATRRWLRFAGAEDGSCVSKVLHNSRYGRVLATKHASRRPYRLLERRHGFTEIVERGGGVRVQRYRPPWRPRRWNPVNSWSRGFPGSPRVGTRRRQTPTPRALGLPSVDTYRQGAWRCAAHWPKSPEFWIQSSLESTKHRRMRCRRLPDPRAIPERVRGPICVRKK